jgi:hypothetical protein
MQRTLATSDRPNSLKRALLRRRYASVLHAETDQTLSVRWIHFKKFDDGHFERRGVAGTAHSTSATAVFDPEVSLIFPFFDVLSQHAR